MEVLLEIIIEVFGELLMHLFVVGVDKVFDHISENKKALKITKIAIYSILSIALIVLLTISLMYKKSVIAIAVISYLVFLAFAYYLIFFFKEIYKPLGGTIVRWIVRVVRYLFSSLLIVLACIYLQDQTAKTLLIVGSSVSIVIYIFIDIFRFHRWSKKPVE